MERKIEELIKTTEETELKVDVLIEVAENLNLAMSNMTSIIEHVTTEQNRMARLKLDNQTKLLDTLVEVLKEED